ncbi:unnamed protein product [Rotaria sp. Silwood2]|nr:unnamed protein product [Rotaria sp. Silwood2]CAF3049429.1 unnamed protein product [Rotaria sp. Silwood2]CAF4010971.1 unnamed protein product [Rotaria sp. Silwood2]CAF4503114.1 unnamed protein product [Rotaria sp. Silwood2]
MDSNRIAHITTTTTGSTTLNNKQQGYQSITLPQDNQQRSQYLSIFPPPTSVITLGVNDHLLLPNVLNSQLGTDELMRRQQAKDLTNTSFLPSNDDDDDQQQFCLSSMDAKELSTRLQVNESIITCNANRLRLICQLLFGYHESFRANVLSRSNIAVKDPTFYSKRMSLALEFFLQIDVDTFYMKTCRFRDAQPHPSTLGLFCNDELPQARYSMVPCGDDNCLCCQTMTNHQQSSLWSTIDFANSSNHRFVNGYTTSLNCPATCQTSNIVYVMTCVCGKYEFMDSTSKTLAHALAHHRLTCNQMIHSILTGTSIYHMAMTSAERTQHRIMKRMRLYQHLAHCSTALQWFLERNPNYWCFIPMSEKDVETEDTLYRQVLHSTRSAIYFVPPTSSDHQRKVDELMNCVPLSSEGRHFSCLQIKQVKLFFDHFLLSDIGQSPFVETDMYQMKIIAVLPVDDSILLRYIIETLFIIHAETKLNMICPIGGDPQKRYGSPYDGKWYDNLIRPATPTRETIVSVIQMTKEYNQRPFHNPQQ